MLLRNRLLFNGEVAGNLPGFTPMAGIGLTGMIRWNGTPTTAWAIISPYNTRVKKLECKSYFQQRAGGTLAQNTLFWETQVNYSYNGNLPTGYDKKIVRWNGAVNFTMLKDETVLKLSVFDILEHYKGLHVCFAQYDHFEPDQCVDASIY